MSALIRSLVLKKRAAQAEREAFSARLESLIAAARGEKGEKGDSGEQGAAGKSGSAPDHQWQGTRLRFKRPDGSWGPWVDLKGDPGRPGPAGRPGENALGGAASVRLVTPPPLLIADDRILLPSPPLGGVVHNTALIFADLQADDWLPDGLLTNRDYLVDEHIQVRVEGEFAVLVAAGGVYDGRYAQVSYLTWTN